jgi:RNAse (barnase) inhibitor barstar
MKLERLLTPEQPWLHILIATHAETDLVLAGLAGLGKGKAVCRVVRGNKATTTSDLFDELSAALQFPIYFGENWDAVDECLTDLEWLPAEAYILVITESVHLLEKTTSDQLTLFISLLEGAAEEWSRPVHGQWARPARAFHVLFQCGKAEEKGLRERLQATQAGYDLLK